MILRRGQGATFAALNGLPGWFGAAVGVVLCTKAAALQGGVAHFHQFFAADDVRGLLKAQLAWWDEPDQRALPHVRLLFLAAGRAYGRPWLGWRVTYPPQTYLPALGARVLGDIDKARHAADAVKFVRWGCAVGGQRVGCVEVGHALHGDPAELAAVG